MNIYWLSQTHIKGYDTFSDCVVVAETREKAKEMTPNGQPVSVMYPVWSTPEHVAVTLIGVADPAIKEPRVICASFHAG